MTDTLLREITSRTDHPTAAASAVATAPQYAPGALLTLNEIATLLSHNLKTIKTWRAAGRWPKAAQDTSGRQTWRVPVTDLVAAGDLKESDVREVESALVARRESRELTDLREQVIRLQEQLSASHALADERAATITLLMGLVRKGGAA